MNGFLFLGHVLAILFFLLLALRLGKNSLTVLVALCAVLANLFVVKQMSLFGFAVTCSDGFAVGGVLGLNLLQEYYGKQAAKEALKISLGVLLFFAAMAQIHLLYVPIAGDGTHAAFEVIFASSLRIVAASFVTFAIVQRFDVSFFGFLKGSLPLRMTVSILFSELLDTVLFSYLGLYGVVESVGSIILLSFLTKSSVVFLSAPFVAFSKKVVRDVPV